MSDITTLTAEIVASAAANETSRMRPEDLVALIRTVRAALSEDETKAGGSAETSEKASAMTKAQWGKLITGPKIKSLLDGKLYSSLKRHLARHGHDPKSYRETFGLPADFPMVSPEYSAARSETAKRLGLGARRKAEPAAAPKPGKAAKPRKKAS